MNGLKTKRIKMLSGVRCGFVQFCSLLPFPHSTFYTATGLLPLRHTTITNTSKSRSSRVANQLKLDRMKRTQRYFHFQFACDRTNRLNCVIQCGVLLWQLCYVFSMFLFFACFWVAFVTQICVYLLLLSMLPSTRYALQFINIESVSLYLPVLSPFRLE